MCQVSMSNIYLLSFFPIRFCISATVTFDVLGVEWYSTLLFFYGSMGVVIRYGYVWFNICLCLHVYVYGLSPSICGSHEVMNSGMDICCMWLDVYSVKKKKPVSQDGGTNGLETSNR